MVKGSQVVILPLQVGRGKHYASNLDGRQLFAYGGTMWKALTAETRRAIAEKMANFMTGA